MKNTETTYTPGQISDAKQILEAYARVPDEKKPVLAAMMTAFISGMETQERLESGKTAKAII